jgi:RXT2-like, N-terminal
LLQKIEHAGYGRHILRRNPKRFDEDGFELLSDEEDEEADKEAAEKNPYSGIQIERKPLLHASRRILS